VNLTVDAVAEIDSLPLLMHCVADGIGATIKPMAAVYALQNAPEQWRCLRISDAEMVRRNYLYALGPEKLSQAAAIVRDELKHVVRTLIGSNAWQGVRSMSPLDTPAPERVEFDDLPMQGVET
jgi:LysR family tcuABC transcriptional regulator